MNEMVETLAVFVVIQNREVAENFVNVHRMYTKFFVTLLL